MKLTLSLTYCLLGVACAYHTQGSVSKRHHWNVGQTVKTSSGSVTGIAASNRTEVSAYLGIRYGKSTAGDMRFLPPQEYKSHSKINTTKFGPSCPIGSNFGDTSGPPTGPSNANLTATGAALIYSLSQPNDTFSEDCLSLNIWTKPQSGEKKKAVLVWIYGGGFTTGSSSSPATDGQYFADEEDVVVVSFNYRLAIFGFPGSPTTPANIGLLDQRLAIQWIHKNIRSFGGDPHRITLFGQSAGSASIDFYSYAWTSDPLVHGLIMQSGTTGVGIYDANTTASSWYNVSSTLGCGDANSNADDVLICMRTKNITEIVRAIPVDSSSSTGSAAFWPTIDEVTVFSDYHARSLAGRFIKVPLLIGNTDYEGGFYATLAAIAGNVLPRAFWETFSDEIFTCPAANRANVSVSAGLPTWRYRYFGSFENLRLTTEPNSGAYHASEVPVLFGDLPPDSTEDEIAVGNYMRGAWASFAKDPNMGLKNYWWPRYRPGTNSLVRLAFDNQTGANAALAGKYDGSCDATFPVGKKG